MGFNHVFFNDLFSFRYFLYEYRIIFQYKNLRNIPCIDCVYSV